ncbi:MAG: hypothetical protein BWY90_00309 [Deltaproteobacteria bacterium ADurb.BinA014]|nr:MAG: hypothetical protein BWY90_00309 [Deltaproteobacteria bacterium ADurb.BinA014]
MTLQGNSLFRTTVGAVQIASVGNRNTQVVDFSFKIVTHKNKLKSLLFCGQIA